MADCTRPAHARSWCGTHYARWKRLGTVELTPYVTPSCSAPHCEGMSYSNGLCIKHYHRVRKYGSLELPRRRSFEERFWSNVLIDDNGCWLWQGKPDAAGYGRVSRNNKVEYAHRVSYQLTHGSIDPELTIDHLCRVTMCINADHLELVTLAENARRAGESRRASA